MNLTKKRPNTTVINKRIFIVIFIAFQMSGMQSISAAELTQKNDSTIDDSLMNEPVQGVIIPCERCVILYPENYQDDPKFCPICHGTKEHFQAFRMMTDDLALSELQALDQQIIRLELSMIMDSFEQTITINQLKELRNLYKQKLFHLLIYGPYSYEPTRDALRELDASIEFREKI